MPKQEKQWDSNFALDEPKLTRLYEVVVERMQQPESEIATRFVAQRRKNALSTVNSLEDVLQLDNPKDDRIISLTFTARTRGLTTEILFEPHHKPEGRPSTVRLEVSGEDGALVNQTYSAATEQIERAFVSRWPQGVAALLALGMFVLVFASLLQGRVPPLSPFTNAQLESLAASAPTATTQEARISWLFEVERAQIENLAARANGIARIPQPVGWILGGSIVIVCGLLVYLAAACYPRGVFEWGDYGEHFASLVNRRKGIWKFLMLTIVGETFVGLLLAALLPYFHLPK